MNDDTKKRINKGIIFLRGFNDFYDVQLYHKSVLRFVELVDKYINGKEQHGISKESVRPEVTFDPTKYAEEIFKEEKELQPS